MRVLHLFANRRWLSVYGTASASGGRETVTRTSVCCIDFDIFDVSSWSVGTVSALVCTRSSGRCRRYRQRTTSANDFGVSLSFGAGPTEDN